MTGAEIAETLTRWLAQGVTGAVEWQDERRRRLFFLEGGRLVAIQSNLKSESPARVTERRPDLGPEEARIQLAADRVRGALGETRGHVQTHIGVEASTKESLDLLDLLWRAADALPRPPDHAYPRLRGGGAAILHLLPTSPDVVRYLIDLDGTRSLDDVVAFAPVDPASVANGVALGTLLGAIESPTDEVPNARVTTQRVGLTPMAAAAPPALPRVSTEEIHSFIADELLTPAPVADEAMSYEVRIPRPGAAPPAGVRDRHLQALRDRMQNAANHFEVLGVVHTDSPEVIRKAWLDLAKDLHPDRWAESGNAAQEEVTRLFDRVRAAWETLGDPVQRESYVAKVIRGERSEDEKAMDRVREILDAEADFKRGVMELNAGRLLPAHDLFARAVQHLPEEPEFAAYFGYTTFRLALGRDEKRAEAGFRQTEAALKEKENFDQGHVLLGMMYRQMGHEGKAKAQFVQALKIRPTNPDAKRELKRDSSRNPIEAAGNKEKGGLFSRFFGKK